MHLIICFFLLLAAIPACANDIVITEIHHSPSNGNYQLEFIELYNKSNQSINLSRWRINKAISFNFPKNIELASKGHLLIAKAPYELIKYYKLSDTVQILGPFKGHLSGEGETVILQNAMLQEIDRVNYKNHGSWPICLGKQDVSLQLMNPTIDNRIGSHWEIASPSPCFVNQEVYTQQRFPVIKNVRQHPQIPQSNAPVWIRANVRNAQQVEFWYQTVPPGKYIALADSIYQTNWTKLALLDDGKNGDSKANDRIYTLRIPAKIQQHRHLIRYKIVAKGDTITILPRQSNPQPNFAYYTYDSLPDYKGHNLNSLNQLPVCQLIAKAEDVDYLIYEYKKRAYPATGTIIYNGLVYDHIGYRSRGYNNRHSRTKRNLKFNFHKNNPITVVDNNGKTYAAKRDKLVLSGGWLLDQPNFHGLAETVLYRLFTLQGVSATQADYVHLRVVDHENEQDSTHNDFFGLYLMLENYDGDFLKTHQLPDANIYSYKPFKTRYQSNKQVKLQKVAYEEWDTSYLQSHPIEWWKKTLDWENYVGFLIGNELVGNRETGYRKQHWWTEYRHPQKGWQFFPWDVDKTWSSTKGRSTISYSIFTKAFEHKTLEQAYQNQLRSVVDLLFNEEQAFQLIDEAARPIYQPQQPYSWVDMDRLRWGHKYKGNFKDQLLYLKQFVQKRRAYLLEKILVDHIPKQPTINYIGTKEFLIGELSFECQNIKQTSIAALEWHLAEVSDLNNSFYSNSDPKIYEIATIWKRKDTSTLQRKLTLPFGAVMPNRSYRVRVRVKDTTGYYSHWSEPVQFIPKVPQEIYGARLVINELLVDSKDGLEFIEIYNPTEESIQLENFEFQSGIRYLFPKQSSIPPKGYWVVTNQESLFQKKYGFAADGVYQGRLSNEGEQLMLVNAFGNLIDSLSYAPYWEGEAQGTGMSLELIEVGVDNALASNWSLSTNLLGTPGTINTSLTNAAFFNRGYWGLCLVGLFCLLVYSRYRMKQAENLV